ncbi:MAG: hypothetical protein ACFE95_17920 [Candidatus Hodarchaeota archaeon]
MKKYHLKSEIIHDGLKEAKKRDKIANQITDDEIFVQTVYNALKVPDASIVEKLTFAFTSIPETMINFHYAKNRLSNILDLLATRGKIILKEVIFIKHLIQKANSFEELLALRIEPIAS